jgi:hypothetical protein
MSGILSDLQTAFGGAIGADPIMVLLPLALVAIAQGLRSDGPGEVVGNATTGLLYAAAVVFLLGGLLSAERFDLGMWQSRAGSTWDSLLGIGFIDVLGFWLFILAGTAAVFAVRSVVRR